ncbi:tetratricopeptide repeat protein [Caenimonas sedimenti]|uniref:Tetratricopeptide repeat protein n=1 Tax=Caenimonas sedimenti TaxID=2596921 RepID=A0A562ZI30_9BURK|nr:winged helix-turn-helix domain-containing protein [Caenimonas sedimenti]TWO68242.1 tetratricopeptide repeat protein [Caenimonas sedimenti]
MAPELTFSTFTLRVHERQLLADGRPVSLGARAFDVLAALVARAGELVSKSELFDLVWPGLVVEENNLQVHISTLRKRLGAELIATIPGRGYRFTARVTPRGDLAAAPPAAQATMSARSIAVLPFTNLGTDPDQEYFSDGLAEDIINKLTRSPWLHVIARNSSFAFRGRDVVVAQAGRALGARYLATGTVRRSGTTLRVSAELIDGQRQETLWAQQYDRPLADLFQIQSEISTQIVSTIEPVYLRREEYLTSQSVTPGVEHWELLMRARWHFWRSTREHVDRARDCLAQALQRKPDDPASLSLLAFTHMSRVWAGWAPNPREEIVEANRLALRAVRQDDTDSFAHFTLGTALSFTGNIPQAIAELEHALALYPQFAAAAGELGRLLAFSGRTSEAVEYVLQAIDASPHDPHLSLWVRTRAIASFVDGDYDEASRYARQAAAKRPDWFFNYYLLAACEAGAGRLDTARQSLQRAQAFGSYGMPALQAGHPFTDPALLERFAGHLREAGWPG